MRVIQPQFDPTATRGSKMTTPKASGWGAAITLNPLLQGDATRPESSYVRGRTTTSMIGTTHVKLEAKDSSRSAESTTPSDKWSRNKISVAAKGGMPAKRNFVVESTPGGLDPHSRLVM